jgi:hypothetical protein
MIGALWRWLGGGFGGSLAGSPAGLRGSAATLLLAVLCLGGFVWQTARIEGLPLAGGGLKADIAQLRRTIAAQELADTKARADALAQRQAWAAQGQAQARAHLTASDAMRRQIETIVEKVPVYVSEKSNAGCVVPWGVVRLLDAAASGASLDAAGAAIAPGRPDDAPSSVALSEAVALLAADLGIARRNADQLDRLQKAVTP